MATTLPTLESTNSLKEQDHFLNKLRSGLYKLIGKKNNSIINNYKPKKISHYNEENDNGEEEEDDDDDNNHINKALKYNLYSKDDCFERNQYLKSTQHQRRPSAISVQTLPIHSPPSILMNNNNNNNKSRHRYTHSLQNTSIISTPPSYKKTSSSSSSSITPQSFQHTRQYSHVSYLSASNITINSEDLTAKEFADMAGIKIVPDDIIITSSNQEDENDHYNTNHSSYFTSPITLTRTNTNNSKLTPNANSTIHSNYTTSYQQEDPHHWSILSYESSKSQPNHHIWDNQFWRRPSIEDHHYELPNKIPPLPPTNSSTSSNHSSPSNLSINQLPTLSNNKPLRKHKSALFQHRQTLSLPPPIPPISSTKIRSQHGKSKSTCDLPIVHELRRMHSLSNDKFINNDMNHEKTNDFVIKKGRFEIQLESSSSTPSTSPISS